MALILQLDSAGQPSKWINWQLAVTYHAKGLVAWELGQVETVVKGGTSAMTGERTVVVTSSILALKGGHGKKKYRVPVLNNRVLFQRDYHMCAYCGGVFTDHKLTRDHVIPSSRNGEDTWMNCVTSCTKCNQKKDNRTPEEARMQLLYVPYVPNKAEHLILSNRNVLADQMEFLLGFVPANSRVKKHLEKN